ncbi:MAG: YggS family pyridoxal phosphate-dependent enzyme, partial [Clostridiales bacterium]
MSIAENIATVQENIRQAQQRSSLAAAEVLLLAVSKTRSAEMITEATHAGLTEFGENKVQELIGKYELVPGVSWHLIGHLQTNKVKYIIGKTKLIHSLDRLSLAEEIDKRSAQAGLITEVLVQLNIAEEDSKSGLMVDQLSSFLDAMSDFKHVLVR